MRNFTITKIWGIPIRLNISLLVFLPILAWLIGSGQQIEVYAGFIEGLTGAAFDLERLQADNTPWIIGFAAAVGLFISVTIHELGHSWVSLRYGIEIESITLWILGGMAALKSIPREWNRELWIAIAGPLVSLAVAAVCWLSVLALPQSLMVSRFVVGWLAVMNLSLAAFNLLPAFPMDGGRIFRALLARKQPYVRATRTAARVGVLFAFLFAIVGVLYLQIIMILLAFFIYGAATTESRTVLVDELLEGLTVGDIMSEAPRTVSGALSIDEFGAQMLRDRQTVYLVADETANVIGTISLQDLRKVSRENRETTTVRDIIRDVPRVSAVDDAFDTLARLGGSASSTAIVESNGSIVGLLSEGDYGHALAVQREFRGDI